MIKNQDTILVLKEYNMAVKYDDGIFFSYDFRDNDLRYETEGKLVAVCTEISEAIVDFYGVNLSDCNITINDETVEIPAVNNSNYTKSTNKKVENL